MRNSRNSFILSVCFLMLACGLHDSLHAANNSIPLSCDGQADCSMNAAYDLIERVTPGYGRQFRLELIESENGADVYEIDYRGGKVVLRGNNAVSIATAYNQYLKYTCNVHLSWCGDRVELPKRLPRPHPLRNTINGKYRVYMNYCTVSYSAAWWDWERWQREIDFMAMNSINMPLSVVGIEAVWYNVLLKHGFTDSQAREFLAGPAHSAWQWMQNIQSYGGPLPKSWIDSHAELGRKILSRELELGMMPIQQGFSGYVPRELKSIYPDAKIAQQKGWCGFKGAAQLDPSDSLFTAIGRDFLEAEKKIFGTHGFYAADPFHESAPPDNSPEYLHAVGETIAGILEEFDSDAVWVMQAWSIREDIVKAVPKDRLLILDLKGNRYTRHDGFWGYPFVAGILHNFGGRINMHGDLHKLASNRYLTILKECPNLCGSGLFMEGIEQNPVYYDLTFEMPVHHDTVDLASWLEDYSVRRYGEYSANAVKAWEYLLEGPYRPGTDGTERSSIIAARPALNVKKSGPNAGLGIPYQPETVIKAAGLLMEDAGKFADSDAYRFDLVDVVRQMMTNLGQEIHKKAAQAFKDGDREAFMLHAGRFLELLEDADSLLRTRKEYNFDVWLANARNWGVTETEKDLLERDATSLVTIWGGDGDPLIFDYSWREWAGLIAGYYLPRWKMFYGMLQQCLDSDVPYSEEGLELTHGREAFRANEFYDTLADWELQYAGTCGKVRTPVTEGDEIDIALYMYGKYLKLTDEYYDSSTCHDIIDETETYENLGAVSVSR